MNRRTHRGRGRDPTGNPGSLQAALAHADALIAGGQLAEAREILAVLNKQHPDNPELLLRLMNIAVKTNDEPAILAAIVPLARLQPNDPVIALNLAIAQLKARHLALAQRAFAAFAARWPDHEQAEQARQQAQELKARLAGLWAENGFVGPPDINLLARNEEVQNLLAAGDWPQAARLAEQALRTSPDFVSLRNNLSLAYQNLGQLDRAIATAREVLALDPHNLHALGNLTRFLVLAGRLDEAAATAEQLKAIPTLTVEVAVKQAEALSFLGDDTGILAAFERVQKLKDRDDDRSASALLHHLAAVASLHQGKTLAARRRWQKALELSPSLQLAAANLADLDRPVDERNAPWPYGIEYWLQRSLIEELLRELSGQRSDEAMTRAARRFLQRHPQVAAIVPLLLERGDPFGREFAMRLAGLAQTPELLAALAAFAQSKAGPTQLRLQAAQVAQQGGALPNGMVRFWQGGAWRETIMFGVELHDEPGPHTVPPAVVALQQDAALAIRAGDPYKTERLLKQALEQCPDDPSLLNNLGAAYGQQGRLEEAEAIARRLVAEHPDYLFGITNLVPYLLDEGKVTEAQELINPLLQRRRMHVREFGAMAGAQVNILLVEGKFDGAESWLELWEQADPDHPHIDYYRDRLREARRSRRRKR